MGKICQICKSVSNNIDELYVDSSPKQIYTLLAVLREGNRKFQRTPAHICKFISEISAIFEMFWYLTLQNFKKAAKK